MRYFVTGASGWIGSASITELLAAGHEVLGLARSEEAADRVAALGASVQRGDLTDVAGLRAAAAACDGVVHLGYHHDFSQMEEAARIDRAIIDAIGAEYAGSDRLLLVASGTLGLAVGRVGTEEDRPDPSGHPRVGNAQVALDLTADGVRPVVVRFAPTVHGPGDHGFIAVLAQVARERGVAAWIGDGANRWPAVHRLDAARVVARAVDVAPAGTVLHATAEDGVSGREIATALGASLGVPTASVAPEAAIEHFGWIGGFFGADVPASSGITRPMLDWRPEHPTLLEDIEAGHYPGLPPTP
jgi:nucleoside-diphosphate-sugar epimerase